MDAQADMGSAASSNTARAYGMCPPTCKQEPVPYTIYLEEPLIDFINFMGISKDAAGVAYFATRGTHEYTHTFQAAYVPGLGPAWLMEGGAEYNAYHEGMNANISGCPPDVCPPPLRRQALGWPLMRHADYPGYDGDSASDQMLRSSDDPVYPVTFWWQVPGWSMQHRLPHSTSLATCNIDCNM